MSAEEHDAIWQLLDSHKDIQRTIEEIPGGVKTVTQTTQPKLVEVLRTHVRQMAARVEEGRPVRLWDPVYKDVFDHAGEIEIKVENSEGGVTVLETSRNPDVVPMIRAHARKVSLLATEGHAAARPPWAGGRR